MNTAQRDRWAQLMTTDINDLSFTDAQLLLEVIDSIDAKTRWEETEPGWWLDMMDFRTELYDMLSKGSV